MRAPLKAPAVAAAAAAATPMAPAVEALPSSAGALGMVPVGTSSMELPKDIGFGERFTVPPEPEKKPSSSASNFMSSRSPSSSACAAILPH